MDTNNKEASKDCGPGGLDCYCCGFTPGSLERRQSVRAARRREKNRDIAERQMEEE